MSDNQTPQFPAPQGEPYQPPAPSWAPPTGTPAKPGMSKGKKVTIGIVAGIAGLLILGNMVSGDPATTPTATPAAVSSSSSTPANTPASTPSPSTSDDPLRGVPTEEPEPAADEIELRFGETGAFTYNDNPFEVTVGKPTKAKCKYSGFCDKPETGDRVVNVPILVKNTGDEQIEVSGSQFVIEFADGTRLETSDGNAYQWGPDNTLDYGVKVRPGGTLKTSVTFEAPDGKFAIVLLDDTWGGEDLRIWK